MRRTPDTGSLPWLVVGSAAVALGFAGAAVWTVFRGTETTLSNRKDPPPGADGAARLPQWIWRDGGGDAAVLQTTITATDGARASIRVAADDLGELSVNGVRVGADIGPPPAVEIDLTPHLAAGANEIRIAARNSEGPAGVVAEITLSDASGSTVVRTVTDASWTDGDGRPAVTLDREPGTGKPR